MKLFYLFVIIPVMYLTFTAGGTAFSQEQRLYEQEQIRDVEIPKVSRPPKFEDFINGTPREAELVITDLRQIDPNDGAPVSQPTTAYLSYDDENIYAAFIAKDDPSKIRATITRRDGINSEDRVRVAFDTFHDHQRNYWFESNAYGVQMDGTNTNFSDDVNFDTLWYSQGRIVEDGYVVLMTIPFKSMRFPNTPEQTWGLVVSRAVERNNEWSNWPHITRRRLPSWQGQFGHMSGIRDISPGRNMQFIPYAGFSRANYWNPAKPGIQYETQNDFRAGLDAKIILRDALTLDLTLNPDFSQVESDSPQVTINQRFEVFFPEKRPFFMENADYFSTPETIFFSRRMADPQFGARVTGKFGRWGVGALAGDDRAPGDRAPEDADYYGDRAAVGIFRLYRELGRESRIGGLITSRDFAGSSNRVFSLDTRLKLTPSLTLTGQWMGSRDRNLAGDDRNGTAGFVRLAKSGPHFSINGYYRDRSPGFRANTLGFINRVNIRETGGSTSYIWRPQKGNIFSYGPSLSGSVIYDYNGTLVDWTTSPSFRLELPRNTSLSFAHNQKFEHFADIDFRMSSNRISASSQWQRWLHLFIPRRIVVDAVSIFQAG
jgi:hypothetical protein